ncbi:Cytosolic purine 5'-nucleotidase [Vitis vinifera]|uniref:Cytosolic purine 5'-nucleotidase n=1 Tax=Vitis vinifera TaxID=29760 RepID=A0A438K292_VITVI|nr:Cytosolic purine 5'-nucleotidase [Vitis vinifera]
MSPPAASTTCHRTLTTTATPPLPESDSFFHPPPLPICLFKSTMRIPKKPVSFCLSFFSSQLSHPFSPGLHFSHLLLSFFPQKERLLLPEVCTSLPSLFSTVSYNGNTDTCCRTLAGSSQLHTNCTMGGNHKSVDDVTLQFQHTVCSNDGQGPFIWSSPEGGCQIDIGKKIFCNRSLNMKNIVAVGFDMDYTLAQYMPETFESLAYEGTIRKLVYDLGYPRELLEWTFDWKYMVRGLVLDKKRGNILKMDRHKYVKVAYHGFREMSKEDKVGTYGNTLIRDSFDEPDYALIDTLFSLAEAYLFAQLVDFRDKYPSKVPDGADYSRMYKDVRAAVDLCHRDGTLKKMVAKDPKKYINDDTSIVPMMKMLRDSGRSTFLVTNSLWDYTNIVMNFLCGPRMLDGSASSNFDWLQYFDVVITGSAKPSFFHDDNRANLFEVEPESGMLLNTDNGTPMPQVGNTSPRFPLKGLKKTCRVFQGGSVGHLHKLLSIESSSQVLYVGDHIYGDILRSKKVLGWRTMLVVPELEREVELLWELRDTRKQLRLLRNERDLIEDKIHHLKWSLKFDGVHLDEKPMLATELSKLELLSSLLIWCLLMASFYSLRGRKFASVINRLNGNVIKRHDSINAWTKGIRRYNPKAYPNGQNHEPTLYTELKFRVFISEFANRMLTIFSCNFIQFHKVWGQLMKTGYQNSRFAHQV